MTIEQYIDTVSKRYQSGISSEHSYRGDLENLIRSLTSEVEITNEPSRVTDCGNPDYVITRGKIPVGYIEAKDLGKDLNSKSYKEQFTRYRKALDNLIITDYLWFRFFRHGELVHEIRIGEISDGVVQPLSGNFREFESLVADFCTYIGQSIWSPKKLAGLMAAKARLLENILERALTSDEETHENTALKEQYEAFKQILIHDLTPKAFADIYSQTLAYGMFAARLHDPTEENFSRQEAAELIPKTNPFLRKLFNHVAGPDIDERIRRTVDNLAEVFRATKVERLKANFGKATQTHDPIIHFYETFLAEYDPKLRKSRGVWYTPQPVVNFIVRAVDDILKTEFGLPEGLADTSKTRIKIKDVAKATADRRSKVKQIEREVEVHKVQILDPATGTGTFLAEVVKHIHSQYFEHVQGAWSQYVENDLVPRLNGFELLMASYSMAHLKLDMLLRETGYEPQKEQRFNVYLTNSLEEHHPDTGTLFASWLSSEANEANHIKRDTPVMVVMGNPPYSGESANKGKWIMRLMEDYKKEPGGKQKLQERNPKWLNDDYVKFIRYGQHFIEKNGEGVLAYINPHGFLDNPTFRGMRWNLLKTFDKIYTIDLHGNSNKKETCPDGSPDVNVFDIKQGVSVNLFVKTGNKKLNELGRVFHRDVFGSRELKYNFLQTNSIKTVAFEELPIREKMFYMVQKDFDIEGLYQKGFKINELFITNNVGIVTSRDSFIIDADTMTLSNRINEFLVLSKEEIKSKYGLKENSNWKINEVKRKISRLNQNLISRITYKPFDNRYIYYDPVFIERSRFDIMQHLLNKENVALVASRQCTDEWKYIYCTKYINDFNLTGTAGRFGSGSTFPLYIYNNISQKTIDKEQRKPNFDINIINSICKKIDLDFTFEKEPEGNVCMANSPEVRNDYRTTFAPIDLLDYIYAVLHSPTYRAKYKEFLKIDFPRVRIPKMPKPFGNWWNWAASYGRFI
nr:type ISP restriction/modification enzyme [Prolixibacter bellariivorans]